MVCRHVAINGLTITHGFAHDQGGGILNQGSTLTLSADVLSQNVVLGSSAAAFALGGGLESLAGDLTIAGCTFTGNQALGGIPLGGPRNYPVKEPDPSPRKKLAVPPVVDSNEPLEINSAA
jgi:hypothetical protein